MAKLIKVQTGKGKGKYTTKYTFTDVSVEKAMWWYNCLNTHSGYKKRLLVNGRVFARHLS